MFYINIFILQHLLLRGSKGFDRGFEAGEAIRRRCVKS